MGIILVFVGLIVASGASFPTFKKIPSEFTVYKAWEVSAHLDSGNVVYLVIVTGYNWSWWAQDPPLDPDTGNPLPLALNVTISDPFGTESKFKVFYEAPPEGYEYTGRVDDPGIPILLSKIETVYPGSLEVKEPPDGIGGTATRSGVHYIRIIPERWMFGPAETLVLHRWAFEKEYPYSILFPSGSVIGLLGAAVSVWGVYGSKPRSKSRFKHRR